MDSLEIIRLIAEVIYLITGILAFITVVIDRGRARRNDRPSRRRRPLPTPVASSNDPAGV